MIVMKEKWNKARLNKKEREREREKERSEEKQKIQ
jgi:hypothetical protein